MNYVRILNKNGRVKQYHDIIAFHGGKHHIALLRNNRIFLKFHFAIFVKKAITWHNEETILNVPSVWSIELFKLHVAVCKFIQKLFRLTETP